jgi:SAM-dependent methyltransferase
MKPEFVESLSCPSCGGGALSLRADERDEREVRAGTLSCDGCRRDYPVRAGIAHFLDASDAGLHAEVQGWHEMAGELGENLTLTMTALPYYPHAPWPDLAPDFFQLFEEINFTALRVLDLGAGRTWSTRFLTALGKAGQVVALDIMTTRFLGLETAEIFFREDGIFFERLCGDMHRIPLKDGWADVVFSAASFHHSSDLSRAFTEVRRVLAPGGRLVFISEPNKKASNPESRPQNEETKHGINEHVYSYAEYVRPLRKLGFRVRHLPPRSIRYRMLYGDPGLRWGLPPLLRRIAGTPAGLSFLMRLVRGRLTGALVYRYANLPLTIVATKPAA